MVASQFILFCRISVRKNKTEKIDFKGRKQRKCVKRARWNNTLLDISLLHTHILYTSRRAFNTFKKKRYLHYGSFLPFHDPFAAISFGSKPMVLY